MQPFAEKGLGAQHKALPGAWKTGQAVALDLLFVPPLIHPGRETFVLDEAGIPSVADPSITKPVFIIHELGLQSQESA